MSRSRRRAGYVTLDVDRPVSIARRVGRTLMVVTKPAFGDTSTRSSRPVFWDTYFAFTPGGQKADSGRQLR